MPNRTVPKCAAILALVASAWSAHAQVWHDAATGQTVASGPFVEALPQRQDVLAPDEPYYFRGVQPEIGDPNHAFDQRTGRNFFFDSSTCQWKDSATGQTVASGPFAEAIPQRQDILAPDEPYYFRGVQPEVGDPNHAFDQRTGRNFFRTPCAKPKPAQSAPPPPPPPPPPEQGSAIPPPTRPLGGPYVGLGGSYFFEPDTKIGLASALVGYRLTPNVGIELQGEVGVTKEKFDNGSTFKSSTGIDWSLYPMVVGYLPVGGNSDLFVHGGYGVTRFGSKATSFSGSSSSSFEDHETVGTGILGGGADIHIGGESMIRLEYDRQFFDNGSEGNRIGLSFVHTFGLRASALTGFPGPGGGAKPVPPPPPAPPPPAPPPPPPPE